MSHPTDGIFSLHSYWLPHFQSLLVWGYFFSSISQWCSINMNIEKPTFPFKLFETLKPPPTYSFFSHCSSLFFSLPMFPLMCEGLRRPSVFVSAYKGALHLQAGSFLAKLLCDRFVYLKENRRDAIQKELLLILKQLFFLTGVLLRQCKGALTNFPRCWERLASKPPRRGCRSPGKLQSGRKDVAFLFSPKSRHEYEKQFEDDDSKWLLTYFSHVVTQTLKTTVSLFPFFCVFLS